MPADLHVKVVDREQIAITCISDCKTKAIREITPRTLKRTPEFWCKTLNSSPYTDSRLRQNHCKIIGLPSASNQADRSR